MVIRPLQRSPIFYNRVTFIPGMAGLNPVAIATIPGQHSIYLESMRKLREVLNYGTTRIVEK